MNPYSHASTFEIRYWLQNAERDLARRPELAARVESLRAEIAARENPAEVARRGQAMRQELTRSHTRRVLAEFVRDHGNQP